MESWTPIKIQKDFEGKSTKEIEKVLDFESDKRDELNEILTKVLNKKGIKYNTWKDEKGKDKADLPIEIDISKTLEDNLKIVMSKVEKGKIVGFFEEEEREKPIREARQKKERQEREKLTKLSEEDRKVLTTEWERYLPEAKKQGFTKEELLKTPTIPGKTGFSDRWTLPKLKNFSFNDNKIRAVLKKLEKERPPNEEYAYASVQLIKEILGGTGDQKLVEDRKTQAKEVLRPYNLKDVNKWKKNYLHEKDDNVDLENIDTKKK